MNVGGLILFLLISITARAGESDCVSVDLNASPSSPFRSIPVEDQDGSGICYAYTASTLANYWHIKNGGSPAQGVNPIFLAHLYNKDFDKNEVSGGNAFGALHELKNTGNCPEIKADALLKKWSVRGLSHVQVLALIEESKDKPQKNSSGNTLAMMQKLFGSSDSKPSDEVSHAECSQTVMSANRFLKSLPSFDSNQLLKGLFEECRPLETMSGLPYATRLETGSDDDFNAAMGTALKEGKPIGISMCAEALRDKKFKGLAPGTERNYASGQGCGNHAVVLSGMKSFGGECRVLIRNSWGADWRAKGTECACVLRDGTYQESCKDFSEAKEVVGCWFPRDRITSNTYRIITL
jgi:hypothetical protein